MDITSKENIIGPIISRSVIKAGATTQSIKKPLLNKKALADVGNVINSTKKKKSNLEFVKPGISGQKLESTKNFKVHIEDEDVIFSPAPKKTNTNRTPLSPISQTATPVTSNPYCENHVKGKNNGRTLSPAPGTTKITASLNSCHHLDSNDDEDGHSQCSTSLGYDDYDDFLPQSLRLNSDDFDSLAMFKPPLRSNWTTNISIISDGSDFSDLNVPFPSPPKFNEINLPFNEFVVPGINFDDSF